MDMDQVELDAAYDQSEYAPLLKQIIKRYASASLATRAHLGEPQRVAYGPTEPEKLDIYRSKTANAPIYVFTMAAPGSVARHRAMPFPRRCLSAPARPTSRSTS
jgi:hypothetical protein